MSQRLGMRFFSPALVLLLAASFFWARPRAQDIPIAVCDASHESGSAPVVNVRNFGARGDGKDDDGAAINQAIASLDHGGTVLFPPGVYAHGDVLTVLHDNITLAGPEAVLIAMNPDRSAVVVAGENAVVRDLTLNSSVYDIRGDKLEQSGIVITGPGARVLRTKVSGFKSTGIMVDGARDYIIACNSISNTRADGIHSTNGATRGRVAWNNVFNSGDDGIAVVSYDAGHQATSVIVENNNVEYIRWGRGISVIGSSNVTIRRNRVKLVAMAAGIIVAREASFHTPGASKVIIDGNELSNIQQKIVPLHGSRRTGHAAIELNSDNANPEFAVSEIDVVGNTVDGSAYDGIRLLGNVCAVSISSNTLNAVGGQGINVKSGCSPSVVRCLNNVSGKASSVCD